MTRNPFDETKAELIAWAESNPEQAAAVLSDIISDTIGWDVFKLEARCRPYMPEEEEVEDDGSTMAA